MELMLWRETPAAWAKLLLGPAAGDAEFLDAVCDGQGHVKLTFHFRVAWIRYRMSSRLSIFSEELGRSKSGLPARRDLTFDLWEMHRAIAARILLSGPPRRSNLLKRKPGPCLKTTHPNP